MDRTGRETGLWAEARSIAARHGRGGAADAGDDLAQDLAVAALEAGEGQGGLDRPAAWLERVGRNAAIDGWRSERRRGELAPQIEPPAAPPDPESVLLGRERRGLVRRALAALPRPQRRAALLRFAAELPFESVAAQLGTPAATARTRLHRALARLRAQLGGLRVLLPGWPAAQTAAFVLALVAVEAPAQIPTLAIADGDTPRVTARQRAVPVRVMATSKVEQSEEDAPSGSSPAPGPKPIPGPQVFVFGDDRVIGDVLGPEGERLSVVRPVWHPSLIELRRHFVPEVLKSLEEF
jgi:RNA polymerase sigma-70 factor (ECF subfamily)